MGAYYGNPYYSREYHCLRLNFYTTYYLAPKESKNIDGPISFAPLMMRPISFATPNDASKILRPPFSPTNKSMI